MRTILWRVVVLGLLLVGGAATAATSTPLWIVDSRLGSTLLRVDPATGARSFVDVSAYPLVLALGTAGMQSPTDEQLYLEAVNAAQGAVLIRYDPVTGDRRLISEDLEGSDLGLLSENARFVGYAAPKIPPPPRTPRQRLTPP
jgi:hypothetical protein